MNPTTKSARWSSLTVIAVATIGCGAQSGPSESNADTQIFVMDNEPSNDKLDTLVQRFNLHPPSRGSGAAGDAQFDGHTDELNIRPPTFAGFLKDAHALRPEYSPSQVEPAGVRLPLAASGQIQLVDTASGMAILVRLVDANAAQAQIARNYLVYEGAVAGSDVLVRVTPEGVEDSLVFEAKPFEELVRYEVELESGVAGLRHVSNTVEFLDESGSPRLRVAEPTIVDRFGRHHQARLSLSGCAADLDPRGPWGRPVVRAGSSSCVVTVAWSLFSDAYPILVDPPWTTTQQMSQARTAHIAMRLPNNTILVAGGSTPSGPTNGAEIWNPSFGTWAAAASMAYSRSDARGDLYSHDGTSYVIICGGTSGGQLTYCGTPCSACERYNATTMNFEPTASMSVPRYGHTLTTLSTLPARILVTGGMMSSNGDVTSTAEVYIPNLNTWVPVANMSNGRVWHRATALSVSNGSSAIITGGRNILGLTHFSAERFLATGASSNTFVGIPSMAEPRKFHSSTRFGNDRVLVVSGDTDDDCASTAEYFDPVLSNWVPTVNSPGPRCEHSAALLSDSQRIVIAGGSALPQGLPLVSTFSYNPATNQFTQVDPPMSLGRVRFRFVAFQAGAPAEWRALAIGGYTPVGKTSNCEWYDD
jgi:hypothetical protein